MQTNTHFWSYLVQFSLEYKVFHIQAVDKLKTRISCSGTFFFLPENRAGYEILWKNIVESERAQVTTWRMHISHWIP